MAGLIKREDIDAVRERTRIEDIVSQHVTLRSAGVGSMKGLCPFHDEKTPSFHVRPQVGRWHCFGCGEGGDVISFVQRVEHLSFVEAVEYLAERLGIEVRYEDGGSRAEAAAQRSVRQRLLAAHEIAETYFREQLASPEAAHARAFLTDRGFDAQAAEHFGVGFAPRGWDNLLKHLRGRGFTEQEISASGLVSPGSRGVYDRFRGRLMWPIRDIVGATIGFGARKLDDEDRGPKYLNTPETAIYKKSQVLYGIDLAKREIARRKQIIIVEGYTDVMAVHLAGLPTAVATCGTAFGADHVRIVRRLLGDSRDATAGLQFSDGSLAGGEVIFTFDGDEAGRKAALRAYHEDQAFGAQTFVAIEPRGMDPCDVRLADGDEAVRRLIEGRTPLFAFVLRSTLAELDLDTAEGRVRGLRACAPVVAQIRDSALKNEYVRELAGWLGMEQQQVARAVRQAGRGRRPQQSESAPHPPPLRERVNLSDPVVQLETQALQLALQHPVSTYQLGFDSLDADTFSTPVYRALFEAIRANGGTGAAMDATDAARWLDAVLETLPEALARQASSLAVSPIPVGESPLETFTFEVLNALVRMDLTRKIAQLKGELARRDPDEPGYQELFARLVAMENERRARQP
ncbi:MAG: DNA primase [Bowdeniella nasicola]|nr:DNA primase [Bowdeniella nasicola]